MPPQSWPLHPHHQLATINTLGRKEFGLDAIRRLPVQQVALLLIKFGQTPPWTRNNHFTQSQTTEFLNSPQRCTRLSDRVVSFADILLSNKRLMQNAGKVTVQCVRSLSLARRLDVFFSSARSQFITKSSIVQHQLTTLHQPWVRFLKKKTSPHSQKTETLNCRQATSQSTMTCTNNSP